MPARRRRGVLSAALVGLAALATACGPSDEVQQALLDEPDAHPVAASDADELAATPEPAHPARVRIPAIGVNAEFTDIGLQADGAMETPPLGSGLVGWYQPGPKPGQVGPAGSTATFVATANERTPKDQLPADRIWSDEDEPVLRLITCGGRFDPDAGRHVDNDIVYAEWADA